MQHQWVVAEPVRIVHVWGARDRSEHDEITATDQALGMVVDDDGVRYVGALQVVGERGGMLGADVVDVYLVEGPAGGRQIGMDIPGYQPSSHEFDPGRPYAIPAENIGGEGCGCRRSGRADDGTLQAGKGVSGLLIIEHEYRRRSRQSGCGIPGKAGNPLHSVQALLAAEGRRKCYNSRLGFLGK